MKLIYFRAGSHQLSRPLNILNCLEMDSHNRVLVIQRSGSWSVGVSVSSPWGVTGLKSPSASHSLPFDGAAAEVLQSGCHHPQRSSWRAHQLYFCVCWTKNHHLGTSSIPGRAVPQLLEIWSCGALEIWAQTPQLGCL